MIPLVPLLAGWVTVWSSTDTPAQAELIDVRAAGDIMLGRFVGRVIERRGGDAIFAGVKPLFEGADLVLANLESPLTKEPIAVLAPHRFTADPRLAKVLRRAGFDALSVENNHALDAGEPGRLDTIAALEEAGIAAIGRKPRIMERRGKTISLSAIDFTPGPRFGDPDLRADLRIVLPHWGVEYLPQISAGQREFGQFLAAAGAHLVLGAHPHVIQPVQEIRLGKRHTVIAFSLGNLVFDQPHRGAVLRAMLSSRGVERVDLATVEVDKGIPRAAEVEVLAFDGARFSLRGDLPPKIVPATKLSIDLRGDGAPLNVTLDRGIARVLENSRERWRNEDRSWRVKKLDAGDPDRDGRLEAVLLVEKNGGTHPFLLGERGGRLRIIWGGSATAKKIVDLTLGDFDGDRRDELAVLDLDGELSVWRWFGWGFEEVARSRVSRFQRIDAVDVDGDGRDELVVQNVRRSVPQ